MTIKEYFKKITQKRINSCGNCGISVTNDKCLKCNSCGISYHTLCTGLSKDELDEINKKKSTIVFNCKKCKGLNQETVYKNFKQCETNNELINSKNLEISSPQISRISAGAHSVVPDPIMVEQDRVDTESLMLIEESDEILNRGNLIIGNLSQANFSHQSLLEANLLSIEPALVDVLTKLGEIIEEIKNLSTLYRIISKSLDALEAKVSNSTEGDDEREFD